MKKHINNRYFEWRNRKRNGYSYSSFRLKQASYRVISILLAFNLFQSIFVDKAVLSSLIWGMLVLFSLFDKESNTWDFTTKRLLRHSSAC